MNNCKLCGESPHGDHDNHFMIHFIERHSYILDHIDAYKLLEEIIQTNFIEEDKIK